MLSLREVCVKYGAALAVDTVSLDLHAGEVLAVLGPSGCGKSTLLRAVAGLEPLTSGRMEFDGQDLGRTPTHKRGFALMFQDGQLFDHLSVAANVAYALRLRRVRGERVRSRVAELLALVDIADYGERLPSSLSGGERQRVALARALAVEPRLLLLDEPLSALDASLRERLAEQLGSILSAAQTTALLVTHDHEEAFALADRLAVMRAGRIVQAGPIDEVWRSPVDEETALFLGYAQVLHGVAAERLRQAAQLSGPAGAAVAVRRSALVLDSAGPLLARVVAARSTPEQIRLVLDSPDLGVVDAVAGLGTRVAPGEEVRLRVDVTRLAALSISAQL